MAGDNNIALQQALLERARREQARRTQTQTQSGPGILGSIYENVIGSGAADTPGEQAGELIKGLGAGAMRGITELVGLPGSAMQGIDYLTRRAGLIPEEYRSPVAEAMSGAGLRRGLEQVTGGASEYVAPGTAGEFAGTVGEFVGGGVGGKLKPLVAGGLASEAAGQMTEGTALEMPARIAGAFFGPVALQTGNKTVQAMFKRASDRPSLDTLRDAKRAAYADVDASGVKLPASVADDIATQANAAASATNYVPDVDLQTKAALGILQNQTGKQLSISELDKIRQGLWTRYNRAPNEVAIREMIDIVDDAIQNAPGGGELMSTARIANSRFKKAELLDNAFKRAEDQVAATGSGGNTVNKFRQSVSNIINNPKQAKFFTQEEIDFMRQFVRGNVSENTLRLIGKLSPSGNGLMTALNIGAIAAEPMMATVTAAGAGAKALSEASAKRGAEALKTMAATGAVPIQQPVMTTRQAASMIPGLLAQ